MTQAFYAILKASFQGSIVILAVIALRFLLKKAPKSLFCLLWLLAGLRLALPFEIQSPFSLQPRLEDTNIGIQAQQPVQVPDILIQNPEGQPLETPAEPIAPPELPAENGGNVQTDSFIYGVEDGIAEPIRYGDIAARVWLLGAAVMLAASLVSYLRLKRRVREAYLIENGCFECPGLDTAFVLGFFPPRIYLPMGLSDQEKKFVFDHENTHIARHDHWFKVLGYAVLSVHWFNPLVWLGYSLLCRDMELACDEHVVKYMTLPQRKAYSAALLSCGGRTARFAACPVAFGESNPKKRILNVLNYRRPSFWITLLALIAVIFVAACLLTSPENKMEVSEENDINPWNLEMEVTDVSSTGLTVKFVQSGVFPGSDRGQLMYGTDYTLERLEAGNWVEVETVPQENPVGWATVGYTIELNSIVNHHIDWDWLYGELPAGQYRIGKSATLNYPIGDDENQTFYAEFIIEESDSEKLRPIWEEDMMEEEYLAICRDALAEVQSRNQFHISETLVYFRGETEDSRSNVVFWRDGENWLRESYIASMRTNADFLYYDGNLYLRKQEEEGEVSWNRLDGGGPGYGGPWLCFLQWDAQTVTFEGTAREGDEFRVNVIVQGAPPTIGWDDVQEYQVLFCFDQQGSLMKAILGARRDSLRVVSDLTIENTLDSNIHNKLESVAGQRPDASELRHTYTEKQWLEKCRTALESYKNQESWAIQVENSFSGRGVMNSSSLSQWFGCGDDYYTWTRVPDDGGTGLWWDLCVDGAAYHRYAYSVTDGTTEDVNTQWEAGSTNGQPVFPAWPVWYVWDEENIEIVEADVDHVTFTVQGSPFPGEDGIEEYQVTFQFWGDVLKFVEIACSQTNSWGDTTEVFKRYDLYAFAPGEAEKMICQGHDKALLHVHGICNDLSCTDASHDHSGVSCTDDDCTNATHHHGDNHHNDKHHH